MNEIWSQHKDLVILCLLAGCFLGVVLAVLGVKTRERFLWAVEFFRWCWFSFWDWTGKTVSTLFASSYFMWLVLCAQIGFEIFLLQQWIFGYHAIYGNEDYVYAKYVYFPLTLTIPLFVSNVFVAIATGCRIAETSDAENRGRR